MKISDIAALMYETEEVEYICMLTIYDNVVYIGTLADLRRKHPKALNATVKQMFTDRIPEHETYGLIIII